MFGCFSGLFAWRRSPHQLVSVMAEGTLPFRDFRKQIEELHKEYEYKKMALELADDEFALGEEEDNALCRHSREALLFAQTILNVEYELKKRELLDQLVGKSLFEAMPQLPFPLIPAMGGPADFALLPDAPRHEVDQ